MMTFGKVTVASFVLYHQSVYTDDSSAYSLSLTSAGPETLLQAQKGVESFDPIDSSTTTAARVGFMVEDVAGSGPETSVHKAVEGVVQVATTTEEKENVSGGLLAYYNDVPPGYVMFSAACFHCLC